jgi:hypothetical protein
MQTRPAVDKFFGKLTLELWTETPMPSHGLSPNKAHGPVQFVSARLSSFKVHSGLPAKWVNIQPALTPSRSPHAASRARRTGAR